MQYNKGCAYKLQVLQTGPYLFTVIVTYPLLFNSKYLLRYSVVTMVIKAISPCKRPTDLLDKRISSTMETSVLFKEVYVCM